jgi:hypothetical protein
MSSRAIIADEARNARKVWPLRSSHHEAMSAASARAGKTTGQISSVYRAVISWRNITMATTTRVLSTKKASIRRGVARLIRSCSSPSVFIVR